MISEINTKQDELGDIDAQCSKTVKEMDTVKGKLHSIADSILAPFFVNTLGLTNFSVQSDSTLISKLIAEHRAEFTGLIGKMKSQLGLVSTQLSKCEQDWVRSKEQVVEAERVHSELQFRLEQIQSRSNNNLIDELTNQLTNLNSVIESIDTESHRKAVTEAAAQKQAIIRAVSMAELDIERALRERDQVLRRCAVEQVYIPLARGSLADSDYSVPLYCVFIYLLDCGG